MSHGPPGHAHAHGHVHARSRRSLAWALALTLAFGVVQTGAAFLFSSVALLADAAHNLSDGLSIGIALVAAWAATLRARGRRTYGWGRLEILAALLNGLTLIVLGGLIAVEAVRRLDDPPAVDGAGVAAVAAVGILANGLAVAVLWRNGDRDDLNLHGALLHAGSDALASAGTLLAGLLVVAFGWRIADPVVALVVSALVIGSAWPLVRRPIEILLEQAPPGVDPDEIGRALAGVDGVREVHDLHVWTITSGFPALSAHMRIAPEADHGRVLRLAQDRVRRFGIDHTTFQLDRERPVLLTLHRPDCPEAPRPRGGGPAATQRERP